MLGCPEPLAAHKVAAPVGRSAAQRLFDGASVRTATGFWARFRGLMLTAPLPPDRGLLLPGCASVHSFFMRYPIDLVYLDRDGVVTQLMRDFKPWQVSVGIPRTAHTLELPAGSIARFALHVGDELEDALRGWRNPSEQSARRQRGGTA